MNSALIDKPVIAEEGPVYHAAASTPGKLKSALSTREPLESESHSPVVTMQELVDELKKSKTNISHGQALPISGENTPAEDEPSIDPATKLNTTINSVLTRPNRATSTPSKGGKGEASEQSEAAPAADGKPATDATAVTADAAASTPPTTDEITPSASAASATSLSTESSIESAPPAKPATPHTPRSIYQRRVGFDTFGSGAELDETGNNTGGGTGVNYSFSVSAKSADYKRTRESRTFFVSTDLNEYSVHALEWCLDCLVDDGDEVVIVRVMEDPPSASARPRTDAERLLSTVMKRNGTQRQLSIIVEFAVGEVTDTIRRMTEIYRPDSLIVGTRGRTDSLFKSAFMGSISRYCVAKSPVPVVVVRPRDKVRESVERRMKDPSRRAYEMLVGGPRKGVELSRTFTEVMDQSNAEHTDKSAKRYDGPEDPMASLTTRFSRVKTRA